jgi:hypothetical protein
LRDVLPNRTGFAGQPTPVDTRVTAYPGHQRTTVTAAQALQAARGKKRVSGEARAVEFRATRIGQRHRVVHPLRQTGGSGRSERRGRQGNKRDPVSDVHAGRDRRARNRDEARSRAVVITGSHNFSGAASTKNDENFIIIRGDKALAEAYAVNIEGAYQHYRWRAFLDQTGTAFNGLRDDDAWQASKRKNGAAELSFWGVGAGQFV